MHLFDKHPLIVPDVFIAPSASVVGDVRINTGSSVFYGSVLRGDLAAIEIGAHTCVQDRVVITTSADVEGAPDSNCRIGDFVVIGMSMFSSLKGIYRV